MSCVGTYFGATNFKAGDRFVAYLNITCPASTGPSLTDFRRSRYVRQYEEYDLWGRNAAAYILFSADFACIHFNNSRVSAVIRELVSVGEGVASLY